MQKKKAKIKTEWNLKLLYASLDDPKLERDMRTYERTAVAFRKKWAHRTDYLTDKKALLAALRDYEKASEVLSSPKPWWYTALQFHMNSENKKASALQTKFEERYAKAGNLVRFFSLKLGTITPVKQKEFLAAKELTTYRYMLAREFEVAKHNLSEKEEELMSLLSIPTGSLWIKLTEKEVHKLSIRWKGQDIPIEKAQLIVSEIRNRNERHAFSDEIKKKLMSIADIAASELTALITAHKISDEKRGFTKPFAGTVLGHQNDEAVIEQLVSLVTSHFYISQRFFKLHARLLKQKKLAMIDRVVDIGKISQKFPFEKAVPIVREALASVDSRYGNFLDTYLSNGQIDVYPRKGKHGGAYCWGINAAPTFVLLNHNDTVRSVETLGHEMGHAIHGELSDSQPVMYRDYSTSIAETASTFFESVTIEHLKNMLPEKDRIIMLHKQIANDISTIFLQIACFNFENELHQKIKQEGELSAAAIAALMRKHIGAYAGPAVALTERDGYSFVNWSHLRSMFYVYTYAYGQLVSKSLFARWKKDKSFAEKIKEFLSAGGSDTPEQILKKAGIDVTDPAFFKAGLDEIERSIDELERLTIKRKH
ncbi:MAG: M3 family metallopeptidase [Candidatus Pacebacteria bacterium]|nr:M3 family metallopeptidase [Candidatus Paceibacterota bacterium]